MKTIKIFIASSEELKEERVELADLVGHLNYILHKQGINIELVKWEYINQSMEAIHKQAEYNERLKECELCMVLYWTKFGIYTKSELETAFNEHNSGNNPKKLYVYFKKDDTKQITEELQSFRDNFPDAYGHFFTEFNNLDSLKTNFLLQFMDYQNSLMNNLIEIRNSQVYMSNVPVADLSKVAFTGNNEEYNRLVRDIKKTRKLLAITEVDDPEYSVYAQELIELEKKQKEMEESLWNTALTITRMSNNTMSERLKRAIELFNSGDNRGADAILNEEDIYKDASHNLRLIELGEEGRKGLRINIDELKLKINTLKNERASDWGERVCAIHEKIVELTEALYGLESEELAAAVFAEAEELKFQAKYSQALENYEKSLKILLEIFGESHSNVATIYNNIGTVYFYQGDYARALENYELSLEITMEIFGENHSDVATIYNNIGLVYSNLGDYVKALENNEKALKIELEIFGERHPSVATSYNNIGTVYSNQGDYARALEYHEKSLKIKLEIFGENHTDVATSYNNLGIVYATRGDQTLALEYYEKTLKICLEIFGENHPSVATSYNNIGMRYFDRGDYARALEYYEKSLKIRLEIFGESHPSVATSYNNIGGVYSDQRDYDQALENFEEALKIRLEIFGESHPDVAASYNNIGRVYAMQDDYIRSLEYLGKALNIMWFSVGEQHPYVDNIRKKIIEIKRKMSM